MVSIAPHTLRSGHSSSDLNGLHDQEHRNPHQLQAGPDRYSNREGVAKNIRANNAGRRPTLLFDRLRELFQVYKVSRIPGSNVNILLTTPS